MRSITVPAFRARLAPRGWTEEFSSTHSSVEKEKRCANSNSEISRSWNLTAFALPPFLHALNSPDTIAETLVREMRNSGEDSLGLRWGGRPWTFADQLGGDGSWNVGCSWCHAFWGCWCCSYWPLPATGIRDPFLLPARFDFVIEEDLSFWLVLCSDLSFVVLSCDAHCLLFP